MKNKIITAGLVMAGAAGLQTVMAATDDVAAPKFWSISGTLRGFYDDNYTAGSGKDKKGSWGSEVSPTISLNKPLRQTDIGLRYIYGLYYYAAREHSPFDQTHQVDVWLDHSFNERWKANFKDTVAVGQEPELLDANVPYRVNGNNLANRGSVTLNTDWTRLFSTELVYGNNFYDYQDRNGTTNAPSRAGLLNRVEQNASIDLQWHLQAETMAFIGYQLGLANYIGDEAIGFGPKGVYYSRDKDSLSHYAYVGVQHQFTANLSAKVSGGVNYFENYNDPIDTTGKWSPYADVSANYTYAQGSYVHIGFNHSMNATDVGSVTANGSLTQSQESSVLTLDINHSITQKLMASLVGRAALSTYNGGAFDGKTDQVYGIGANLHYQINRHFGVDAGYNFDHLLSDVSGRGYERNRVYMGFGATY